MNHSFLLKWDNRELKKLAHSRHAIRKHFGQVLRSIPSLNGFDRLVDSVSSAFWWGRMIFFHGGPAQAQLTKKLRDDQEEILQHRGGWILFFGACLSAAAVGYRLCEVCCVCVGRTGEGVNREGYYD